ncbi:alpha/beta hydrolase [Gracilibacillus massiliensis]|uniref:alpha/beta hydrolase n=1 Tax=Gracilibacillus massiliensis TaxID=1564956 RepID=UPI00071CBB33|nr:alpha/beta hydrolase [Gracilibacillus massiliensis]
MNILDKIEVNWEEDALHQNCPSITPYVLENRPDAPLVLVIPGGGYQHRAYHEGEPVAEWLNQNGYHACVLRYQVAPIQNQITIKQGQLAIQLIRSNLREWGLSCDSKVGVLGFSAGGHLAATISNHFKETSVPDDLPNEYSSRPDFQILCYPVITMEDHTHQGSKQNLLGLNPDQKLMDQFSCEKIVHKDTPPAFIWTTANDQAVPAFNSLKYAEALQAHDIPYELHIYQDGRHGLGLADEHPNTREWKNACLDWLKGYIHQGAKK